MKIIDNRVAGANHPRITPFPHWRILRHAAEEAQRASHAAALKSMAIRAAFERGELSWEDIARRDIAIHLLRSALFHVFADYHRRNLQADWEIVPHEMEEAAWRLYELTGELDTNPAFTEGLQASGGPRADLTREALLELINRL